MAVWRPPERRRRNPESAAVIDLVVRMVAGVAAPRVALHGPEGARLEADLRRRLPEARLTVLPQDKTLRRRLVLERGPFDVLVDRPVEEARMRRFLQLFFHLRPGGAYVVPDGAGEAGADPQPLGELLRDARADQDAMRKKWRDPDQQVTATLRDHVRMRVEGPHLVLSHDLPGVRAKLREEDLVSYLERPDVAHRVLAVVPAAAPAAPEGESGPAGRTRFDDLPLTPLPLVLREYRDALVGPEQLVLDDRVILPDTYRHHQWGQLVHRRLVSVAPGLAAPLQALPEKPERLAGTFVHLDNEVRGHFGHLMTESLSRVWTWRRALALDPDARVLVSTARNRPEILPYERELYRACGIPDDRLVKIDQPVRVERLISGTPMLSQPQSVHPLIEETWQAVGDRLAGSAGVRQYPRRIFVARRTGKRSCVNAEEVEAVFAEHGFTAVLPEELSLGDQVRMFRGAEAVGGFAGSGMFHIAFVDRPLHVIQVCSDAYNPRNEYLMAAVRRHRLDRVLCRAQGQGGIQSSFRYDDDREGPFLRRLLAGWSS